jgi:hypothetical protein
MNAPESVTTVLEVIFPASTVRCLADRSTMGGRYLELHPPHRLLPSAAAEQHRYGWDFFLQRLATQLGQAH